MSRYSSSSSPPPTAPARVEDVIPSSGPEAAPQTQPADFTLYYDADETASEFPAPVQYPSTPTGARRPAKAFASSPTTPRTAVPARRYSFNSRHQPVGSLNVWAAAAESPRERLSFDRSSLRSIPDDAISTEASPRSTNSELADISSNLAESSDEDSPSPLTPLYDEVLRPSVATSIHIQEERDAALRALESKDPVKARNSLAVRDADLEPSASPSFPFGSPRPEHELPSLTTSLSTMEASVLPSNPPTSRFGSMFDDGGTVEELRDFDISPSVVNVPATHDPMIIPRRVADRSALGIDLDSARSYQPSAGTGFVLDLVEPSSPDSAHFSPSTEIITFASPDVRQLELRFPGFRHDGQTRTRVSDDFESAHSHESPPRHDIYGSPRTPARETHRPRPTHDTDDIRLESVPEPPRKASLLSKFKTIKTKVRSIFSGHTANVSTRSRADSMASELVSPNTPSYLVSLQLPHGLSNAASPASRGRSDDLESLQQPAFTLTDAPGSAPAPRGTRFATVTPLSEPVNRRRSRRFSLQPSFFSRARSNSRTTQTSPNGIHLGVPDDDEAARMRQQALRLSGINNGVGEPFDISAESALPAEDSAKLDAPFKQRASVQHLDVGRDETARVRRRSTGVLGLEPSRAARNVRKRLSAVSAIR